MPAALIWAVVPGKRSADLDSALVTGISPTRWRYAGLPAHDQKALSDLGFEVTYMTYGRVKTTEGYTSVPFSVLWDKSKPQLIGAEFHIEISSTGEFHHGGC